MKGFLDFLPGHSLLHKLHPLAKLFIAIAICASAFVSSSYIFLGFLILLNLLLGLSGDAGTPKGQEKPGVFNRTCGLLKGLLKVSLFLFVLQVLLIRGGNAVITLGNFSLTDKGLNNGALLVLRLIAATLPLSIMITVTNLSDLSNVLVNNLHMPYKYAYTFTTAIRFIPVFGNEMNNIMEAQISRGVDFETKNPFKKIALVLPLCVPLLLSSVRKIDSTAIATELRGFHLRKAGCASKVYKFTAKDIFSVIFAFAVIGCAITAKLLGLF
ncbi:MAG: energy-coupling factor transporter transmembrane protein EcfT [Treponema sp.]|nr:energy-coupling factor transporter transmembrane protein EcfT [Treponema sp.]